LNPVSGIVDKFDAEDNSGAGIQAGRDRASIRHLHHPRSGACRHAAQVTLIKGRRFPSCRACKGIRFELADAAKHVGEMEHPEKGHAPTG
jgi:hypothetical protein